MSDMAVSLDRGISISPTVGAQGERTGVIRYGVLRLCWEARPACHGKQFNISFPGKPSGLSAARETTLRSWIEQALAGR